MDISMRLVLIACFLHIVNSYPGYRGEIPNGNKVPNPCNKTEAWNGVGHWAKRGGGARNSFGLHFKEHSTKWTEALCKTDSDGDGKTNGEELGDPNCMWSKGSNVTLQTTNLSHPGICEPVNSEHCRKRNGDFVCSEDNFVCEAINDVNVDDFVIRLDDQPVPAKETTYKCQTFALPAEKDTHLIAAKPLIDNINVIHHILVYGCTDEINVTAEVAKGSYECFMSRIQHCEDLIAIWGVGLAGTCYHSDTGFRIGKTGYKAVVLEAHWNNPEKKDTYKDSSGMRLYLSSVLRTYDAGMLMIGQNSLVIPPKKEDAVFNATCNSKCTSNYMTGPINIVGAMNHMHNLGSAAYTKMILPDKSVTDLAMDSTYDYNTPVLYAYDDPIVMQPGYELYVECHFDSSSKTKTTFFGEATADEMCFSFIMYYPKEKFQQQTCVSTGPIGQCEWGDVVQGCDLAKALNPFDPGYAARYTALSANCIPGYCLEECKKVIKEINQDACHQPQMRYVLQRLLQRRRDVDPSYKLSITNYWYMLDSCDAELEKETCPDPGKPWINGARNGPVAMFWLLFGTVYLAVTLK